jgi:hypothetical protein
MWQKLDSRFCGRNCGVSLIDDDESFAKISQHSKACPEREDKLRIAPARQRHEEDTR